MQDGQQEIAKLDRRLDLAFLLGVGKLVRSPVKISDV
jgi:hypothetical protein